MNILLRPELLMVMSLIVVVCLIIKAIEERTQSVLVSLICSVAFCGFYAWVYIMGLSAEQSREIGRQVFVFCLSLLISLLVPQALQILRKWMAI